MNYHYGASRSLTLVHSEITKHNNYTLYFTNSTVKSNSLHTQWNGAISKTKYVAKAETGIEDILSNSDFTNFAECPLATK